MRRNLLALPLVAAVALVSTGCIKRKLIDGQLEGTRQASSAFNTIGDYELARSAAQAGLVQFEGLHSLAPDNPDGLFLLVKGWCGYAYSFVEDEMETAQDAGDEDMAEYQKRRARMAYDRAAFYGMQLLAQRDAGFEQVRKNQATLAKWLKDNFADADDAGPLFWTGYAWMARVNLMKGDDEEGPAFVAELYVGVTMMERSLELDPNFEHGSAMVALAAYHARTNMAELDQAKQLFDAALAKTEKKALLVQLNYAQKYACVKGDAALYQQMLDEVLKAVDPDPDQRLPNAIAKRRARRWAGKKRAKEVCGIDLSAPAAAPTVPAPAAAPAPAPAPSK